ncbi:glycosyltransferase family 4 protein [Streptomyces sp. LP05-1]|uniref:Glycosyltransferase family 4 protein n=1 Tax=Streptomyces pyxinae TaxID=2970734 RepID=A0ABT2CNM4_9ACTN|nr:glycosyltransferase family 4 protein [Streptomyces sp. LP05-1]MCS0638296.1 glycosyltransferase family 4 protein [Streptomyces sp. LP05-1]
MTQLRTVHVLGGEGTGSGAHLGSLATGLLARGVRVTVCAPAQLRRAPGFPAAGIRFVPVPRRSDPLSLAALRSACAGADVVHAHDPHAAVRAALALGPRRVPDPPLVLTWHGRPPADGLRGRALRLLETRAVRASAVVLAASTELVDRARHRGARDARLGAVALPVPRPEPAPADAKPRAELGAMDRALVVVAGPLEPHQGYDTLLRAARRWRKPGPAPLIAVVGEGRHRAALQRWIDAERLPVRLLGRRDDLPALMASADLAVLPGRWEGRSPLAQQALRLGVPLVAAAVDGVPELVGEAAELVPYGDAGALAAAVPALLGDPDRRAALAAAGPLRARRWPTEDQTVAQVLGVYDELAARA